MNEYKLKSQSCEECNIIISNIVSYNNDISIGNKYNTTLILEVISINGYRGKSNFVLDIKQLEKFIMQLLEMSETLIGNAKLTDNGYGSYLDITVNKFGHVLITGVLSDEHKEQELKFAFNVDQTFIRNLSKVLYKDIIVEKKQLK